MRSFRSLRRVALLVALTLVGSCDRSVSPLPDEGIFVGRWAGGMWIGDASALVTNTEEGLVLTIFGRRPQGALYADEVLRAQVVYTGPGLYLLGPEDVTLSEIVGGDVVSAEYHGTGAPAGTLRITRFDQSAGVVVGELNFRATTQRPYASYGQTARLEDGAFRAITLPTQLGSP